MNEFSRTGQYRILDLTGKLVMQGSLDEDGFINTQQLKGGIYFLTTDMAGVFYVDRIVKID